MDIDALFGSPARLDVDRAVAEWRAGRPVLIEAGAGVALLAAPIDGLDDKRLAALRRLSAAATRPALVVTDRRLAWLDLIAAEADRGGVSTLEPAADMPARLMRDLVLGEIEPERRAALAGAVSAADPAAAAAVELAKIAHLAPASLLITPDPARLDAMRQMMASVTLEAIGRFRTDSPLDMAIVSQARVPLKADVATRFVVFRGGQTGRDQIAIVIGAPDPSEPVPVRVHSACLTGDLFGSLKCDCGDQLRQTVAHFHDIGGGVLVYLDQEGRGIGIANKMRAYALQDAGFDTIDADASLGFEADERRYDEAAKMLDLLGYRRIRLHSNNPRKVEALRRLGLDVVGREGVTAPINHENAGYLRTKAERAGHHIEIARIDRAMAEFGEDGTRSAAE